MESLRPTWSMQAVDRAHMNTIKQHALNPVESNLEDRPAVEIETFGTTPGDRGLGAERGTIVVSIGILAYNEESSIAGTIESILEQSIVKDPPPGWQVEIVCVPNGCTDLTAEVAGESLKAMSAGTDEPAVAAKVTSIAKPSKHNAWNEFVHQLSRRDATHLVLMDGDVRLVGRRTLESMIRTLAEDPYAHVCGATTVKHNESGGHQGMLGRISLGATRLRRNQLERRGQAGFAGCLYACPVESCRRMVLPEVLVGEDSFLRAVWETNFFTVPIASSDERRVVSSPDARVMFEAYLRPSSVLKNLRRRMVGLTINSMLYDRLWATSSSEADAGELLHRWNREDPDWDRRLIAERIAERGSWVVPGGSFVRWLISRRGLWRWFDRMRGMSLSKKACMMPVAMVGTVLHAYACISANRLIKSGRLEGLWFTTETTLAPSNNAVIGG
jgi:hypothetical protein